MTSELTRAAVDVVQHRIAELIIEQRPATETTVGAVALWPHQRDAVVRVRAAIAEFGGALLADDVGTGKTLVALAVASAYQAPLVVAPAALRDVWRAAGTQAGRPLAFISFEALSRSRSSSDSRDFVIVDEAHHARNPVTRRYDALADLVSSLPALLLSATPIHNRRADLLALLGLFLGGSSEALDAAALSRCVIRRGREALGSAVALPRISGPIAIASDSTDDETPDAILALPPPVPAADAGTANALLAIMLLRQWSSSQGALLAAVRRRLAGAHALAATLDAGRYPTVAELAAWTLGDDSQQLAFSELLSPAAGQEQPLALRAAVAAHIDGLRAIRRAATANPEIDRCRARRLGEIWSAHAGARSIAFSQFAETVDAYWRELRSIPGTCAISARGGRVAGGAIGRAEALGSFAPGGDHRRPAAARIAALLTTDLASEGLDLQDASVLVHLDLPWTPARLEQRLGRIVRPGSAHPVVHVYTIEPPVHAATLLDIHRRLAAKLTVARATLGDVMPGLGFLAGNVPAAAPDLADSRQPSFAQAPTAAAERIESILDRWRCSLHPGLDPRAPGDPPLIAAAFATTGGWLAAVGTAAPRLVAALSGRVGDDPLLVAAVCALIDTGLPNGAHLACGDSARQCAAVAAAVAEVTSWLSARRGATLAGVPEIPVIRRRRRELSAIAGLADAPASARAVQAPASSRALAAATQRLGAADERRFRRLRAPGADRTNWLDALISLGPPDSRLHPTTADSVLRALIVLVPDPDP